jgi:hypothetical protein
MTLEAIKQRYPNEWVLIEFSELDANLDPIEGIVIAHAASHDVILADLEKQQNKRIVMKYTGEDLPVDFTYALCAL